jgi:hypothetical protein
MATPAPASRALPTSAHNALIRRLSPPPQFIVFTGDEIIGLTASPEDLRAQWRHWLVHEMGWLDRQVTPVWHATSNHATYDQMSEVIFRDVLDMPRNGPAGQEGLSYWVRRDDLLIIFVRTLCSALGGEGHVETAWLRETPNRPKATGSLKERADTGENSN